MDTFWDTSAIVPLLMKESHTAISFHAWGASTRVWAWRWLEVETEAALGRRRASASVWAQWRTIQPHVEWLDCLPSAWPQLRAFNRPLRLRAADAAHLFVFDRLATVVPEVRFVCFDEEMRRAADLLGLRVFGDH